MQFKEYVSKENLNLALVDAYIREYGLRDVTNSCIEYQGTRTFLQEWFTNKSQFLFQIFKNKLILEKKVNVLNNLDEVIAAYNSNLIIQNFIKDLTLSIYKDMIDEHRNTNYIESLKQIHQELILNPINICINQCNFSTTLVFPQTGKKMSCAPETKALLVLKTFSDYYKIGEKYEEFRLAHSQFINSQKITGTLCLSIHPMDYFTLSDNENQWSSCLSWHRDGVYRAETLRVYRAETLRVYRAETLRILSSPTAVVAYMRSDTQNMHFQGRDPAHINYEWNSKKWRMLAVVDKNCIFDSTQYPVAYPTLSEIVLSWLKELVEDATDIRYQQEPVVIHINQDRLNETTSIKTNNNYIWQF